MKTWKFYLSCNLVNMSRPFGSSHLMQTASRGFPCLAALMLWPPRYCLRHWLKIASPELRETSLRIYFDLQSPIMEQPETRPFYAELFSLIDLRCKHWAFPSQNQRMDVVIFWQGVQGPTGRHQMICPDFNQRTDSERYNQSLTRPTGVVKLCP